MMISDARRTDSTERCSVHHTSDSPPWEAASTSQWLMMMMMIMLAELTRTEPIVLVPGPLGKQHPLHSGQSFLENKRDTQDDFHSERHLH